MPRHASLTTRPELPEHVFRRVTHPPVRPLDRSRGELNVLIGVPGAGKTSFCAATRGELGRRLSLDGARARLGRGPEDQRVTPKAVGCVMADVARRLREHERLVLDATSVTAAERATWLRLGFAADVPIVAYWITTPAPVAVSRDAGRVRQVGEGVIAEKARCLAELSVDDLYYEGFSAVVEVETVLPGASW